MRRRAKLRPGPLRPALPPLLSKAQRSWLNALAQRQLLGEEKTCSFIVREPSASHGERAHTRTTLTLLTRAARSLPPSALRMLLEEAISGLRGFAEFPEKFLEDALQRKLGMGSAGMKRLRDGKTKKPKYTDYALPPSIKPRPKRSQSPPRPSRQGKSMGTGSCSFLFPCSPQARSTGRRERAEGNVVKSLKRSLDVCVEEPKRHGALEMPARYEPPAACLLRVGV